MEETHKPSENDEITVSAPESSTDDIPESAKPVVHAEHQVGEGMSKKEAMKIRMQNMNDVFPVLLRPIRAFRPRSALRAAPSFLSEPLAFSAFAAK